MVKNVLHSTFVLLSTSAFVVSVAVSYAIE